MQTVRERGEVEKTHTVSGERSFLLFLCVSCEVRMAATTVCGHTAKPVLIKDGVSS